MKSKRSKGVQSSIWSYPEMLKNGE